MRSPDHVPGFVEAANWLDDNFPTFLGPILNMGSPRSISDCPTAYVALDPKEKGGFFFGVNPTFSSSCTTEEFAGALAHETMHVLLSHLTLVSKYDDARRFNLAADAIINDYLTDMGFTLIEGAVNGQDLVGYNCARRDIDDVYHAIPEEESSSEDEDEGSQGMPGDPGDSGDSSSGSPSGADQSESSQPSSDSEGSSSEDASSDAPPSGNQPGEDAQTDDAHEPCGFHERATKALEEAEREGKDSATIGSKIDAEIRKALGESFPADLDADAPKSSLSAPGAGSGFSTAEGYASETGMKVDWVKLLAAINPDILKKPGALKPKMKTSYHAPRRKITSLYPGVILPNSREAEKKHKKKKGSLKPSIVLALDTSGSIPRSMVAKMQELALTVPQDLIDVRCCTFSTQYVPFDINRKSNKIAYGGTAFSAVEEFVRSVKATEFNGSYPSAVVVITDGGASFYGNGMSPTRDQLKENWHWVSTSKSYFTGMSRRFENVYDITDFS